MTEKEVSISTLRNRIMKKRGIKPDKLEVQTVEQVDEWIEYPQTAKMKYIELKFGVKLRIDIFKGSINDVCSRYQWEVDRATISRWRKHIRQYIIDQ